MLRHWRSQTASGTQQLAVISTFIEHVQGGTDGPLLSASVLNLNTEAQCLGESEAQMTRLYASNRGSHKVVVRKNKPAEQITLTDNVKQLICV